MVLLDSGNTHLLVYKKIGENSNDVVVICNFSSYDTQFPGWLISEGMKVKDLISEHVFYLKNQNFIGKYGVLWLVKE